MFYIVVILLVQLVLVCMFFPKWKALSDRIINKAINQIELTIQEKVTKQIESFNAIRGNYTNQLTSHLDREISQLKNIIDAEFYKIRQALDRHAVIKVNEYKQLSSHLEAEIAQLKNIIHAGLRDEELQRKIQVALDNFDKKSKED